MSFMALIGSGAKVNEVDSTYDESQMNDQEL